MKNLITLDDSNSNDWIRGGEEEDDNSSSLQLCGFPTLPDNKKLGIVEMV